LTLLFGQTLYAKIHLHSLGIKKNILKYIIVQINYLILN